MISPFNFNWHGQWLLCLQISNFLSYCFSNSVFEIRSRWVIPVPNVTYVFYRTRILGLSTPTESEFLKNYNHLCLKLPQTIKKHYFVFSLNRYKLLLWGKCPISWIHVIHIMHWSKRDLKNLQNIQILMVWMWNFPYKLSWQHKKQNPSEIHTSEILCLTLNWST